MRCKKADSRNLNGAGLVYLQVMDQHSAGTLQVIHRLASFVQWFAQLLFGRLHIFAATHRAKPAVAGDELYPIVLHGEIMLIDRIIEVLQYRTNVNGIQGESNLSPFLPFT